MEEGQKGREPRPYLKNVVRERTAHIQQINPRLIKNKHSFFDSILNFDASEQTKKIFIYYFVVYFRYKYRNEKDRNKKKKKEKTLANTFEWKLK